MKKLNGPTKQGVQWLALIAVFILAVINWSYLVQAVSMIWSVIFPLILGGMIAFVLNILMTWLEKYLYPNAKNKYLKASRRPVAIILAILVVCLVIAATVVIVLPQLASAIMTLIEVVPETIENLTNWFNNQDALVPLVNDLANKANLDWGSIFSNVASGINNVASGLATTSVSVLTTSVGAVTNIFLGILFAIYILFSKEKLAKQVERLLTVYVRDDIHQLIENVARVANETFSKFISGMVIEAIILGTLVTVGLFILQVPYAAMLGVLQGVMALIPIIGAFLSGAVGVLILLALNPTYALIYLIFVLFVQQLEGDLIYPRVVGDSIGLPSMWVLFAVTVGGGLMGIPGMLIGVPVLASIYKIIKIDVKYREQVRQAAGKQDVELKVSFLESLRHPALIEEEIDKT
ncbi:putative PurR-regulated permease PerM [Aerococcus sp. 150760007-1]|uniref:AI-2E family transporter n=1 Tax=Aerococcus urinaeequi TaxID=51665 RepID=A0ABR5ZWK7_9LACT|nr:AI-2E family transporter [Aerococcus urinaeequi]KAF3299541.1 AI-2E family transporter [Carnobacterium sp. PL17RED31]MBA5746122.1 AI-2E family transporter [Aerococcus urinaeequi]MBA5828906.1 AI-2E family transporter [Aerococcus urinaeequi]MBA5859810.1 AI-2E family transporter [Aerococcus urinaeequi]